MGKKEVRDKSEIKVHTGCQKGRGEGLVGGVVTQGNDVPQALKGVQTIELLSLTTRAEVMLL